MQILGRSVFAFTVRDPQTQHPLFGLSHLPNLHALEHRKRPNKEHTHAHTHWPTAAEVGCFVLLISRPERV